MQRHARTYGRKALSFESFDVITSVLVAASKSCQAVDMENNCSIVSNITAEPPSVQQHLEALGAYGPIVFYAGSIITALLTILYVINVASFIHSSPSHRRRLLCWVTSTYMVNSFLALMTIIVPRAGETCDTVKQIFLPFIMLHFTDLTLDFAGGQSMALGNLVQKQTPMSLCIPPCCCLGIGCRSLTYTKKRLRLIKALVYQMPLVQLVIIVLIALLVEAQVIQRGNGKVDALYLLLNILNIVGFALAMWAYNILTSSFIIHLSHINYKFKARSVGLAVGLLKTQNFILVLLTVNDVIPCVPPYVSKIVLRKTIDAALTLAESLILGLLTFVDYRRLSRMEPIKIDEHGVALNPQS